MVPRTFLNLPSIPMSNVFELLDLVDVFHLSCCSAKTNRIIESSRANLKLDHVKLRFLSETKQSLEICTALSSLEIELLPEKKMTFKYEKEGKKFKNSIEGFELNFDGMEALTSYVLSIWKCSDYSLMWYLERPIDNFLWGFTKNLRILYMSGTTLPPVELTPEELTFILDDVKLKTVFMNLKLAEQEDFQYTKPLQIHDLSLMSPTWLHFDSILKSRDIWNLVLCGYRPKTSDLKEFVRKWMAGEFPKLFFFAAVFDLRPSETRQERHASITPDEVKEILDGIQDRVVRPPSKIQYMGEIVHVPNRISIRQDGKGQDGIVFWGERLFGVYVHATRAPFDEDM